MRIAITGGTGTLGRALIARLIAEQRHERIVSISRDEVKGGDLIKAYPNQENLRVYLGDVRDRDRLARAFAHCDTIVHAAALKRVDTGAAESLEEIVKTNIEATLNVIWAAEQVGAKQLLFVSTDKAVHATNAYGGSKFMSEQLVVQSNSFTYPNGLRMSCTRYGNVLDSRGSVTEIWKGIPEDAPIPITNPAMTRFLITQTQAVKFILQCLVQMQGGEIFVPRLPSVKVQELALALYPGRRQEFIGLRPGGEKLHEVLLSDEEELRTMFTPNTDMVVLPSFRSWSSVPFNYIKGYGDWPYNSNTAKRLTVQEIKELVAHEKDIRYR